MVGRPNTEQHMKNRFSLLIGLLALLGLAGTAVAAEKPVVRVSMQPCMHAMPSWLAVQEGWTKTAPIDLTYMLFSSGYPQNEALAAGEWDVGCSGASVIMAGLRYGSYVIGISNDESETNDLWVRPDSPLLKTKGANPAYPEIYGTAADWKNKKILVTTMSTGHYALNATLERLGLTDKDVNLVQVEPGQALAAFSAGEGDIVQLWAPGSYIAEANGWVKVTSGRRAGIKIPGWIYVRKDFADKNPELVVDWLDLYFRGVDLERQDHVQGSKWLLRFFTEYCGLELTKEQVDRELALRPLFTVEEEVEMLSNPDKASKWLIETADFLAAQGRLNEKEMTKLKAANGFVEPKFMRMLLERRNAQAKK